METATAWATVPVLIYVTVLGDPNPEMELENYGAHLRGTEPDTRRPCRWTGYVVEQRRRGCRAGVVGTGRRGRA